MFAFLGRTALTLGSLAAGSYAVYKGGSRLISDAEILHNNLQILMEEQIIEQNKYIQQYQQISLTSKIAILPFLPLVRSKLLELCDLNNLIKELKQLQSQQSIPTTTTMTNTSETQGNEMNIPSSKENSKDEESLRQKKVAELWEELKIRSK